MTARLSQKVIPGPALEATIRKGGRVVPFRRVIPEAVRDRVLALRAAGMTWQETADELVRLKIPNGSGDVTWSIGAVRKLAVRGIGRGRAGCPACGRQAWSGRAGEPVEHPVVVRLRELLSAANAEAERLRTELRRARREERRR